MKPLIWTIRLCEHMYVCLSLSFSQCMLRLCSHQYVCVHMHHYNGFGLASVTVLVKYTFCTRLCVLAVVLPACVGSQFLVVFFVCFVYFSLSIARPLFHRAIIITQSNDCVHIRNTFKFQIFQLEMRELQRHYNNDDDALNVCMCMSVNFKIVICCVVVAYLRSSVCVCVCVCFSKYILTPISLLSASFMCECTTVKTN